MSDEGGVKVTRQRCSAPSRTPHERMFPQEALRILRCPICDSGLNEAPGRLVCPHGHSFDRARQGYVNLRHGNGAIPQNADSVSMVEARELVDKQGLLETVRARTAALAKAYAPTTPPLTVADLAGGTGYYLAGILDHLPYATGICIDLSTPALRRAARCHPGAAAIGSDLRGKLPLAGKSISIALSIFGPRNVAEIHRILKKDGVLLVVTPTQDHLRELVGPLGMVRVYDRKEQQLAKKLARFTLVHREHIEYKVTVDHADIRSIVQMGPSARHLNVDEMDLQQLGLSDGMKVTISVNAGVYGLKETR